MHVILDEHITIQGLSPSLAAPIIKTLTIPNPKFHQLSRMGKTRAMFGVPRDFVYYRETPQGLSIPIGCKERLLSFLRSRDIVPTIHDHRVSQPPSKPFICKSPWRPHQEGIIDRIDPQAHTHGILQLSTGWGKSFLALKLATYLQQRTLIIVPRHSILEQFCQDIQTHMGIEPGVIQAKNFMINDITVATIQTLQKRKDVLQKYKNHFGLVIVDEADRSIPPKSISAVSQFIPKYRYGLTATPDRTDGQGKAIEFFYGPILVNEKQRTLVPKVRTIKSPHYIPISVNYAEIIEEQVLHEGRNKLLADTIHAEAQQGKRILVLTKRIEHYRIIRTMLPEDDKILAIGTNEDEGVVDIKDVLPELRSNADSYRVLLSTFSLLSTGVDIPSLDTLIIAGDLASSVLTIQSVGRILRLHEGKPQPTIIDVQDIFNPILMKQAKKRMSIYKEMGWELDS